MYNVQYTYFHAYLIFLSTLDWEVIQIIGRGGFGEVELIKKGNDYLAIKKVKYSFEGQFKNGEESKELKQLKSEMKILSELEHENIVTYEGVAILDYCLCMIMEYMPMGSLRKKLDENGGFSDTETLCYAYEILKGLDYLHLRESPIVHGDIKCSNVLLGKNKVVKLCDFGTARALQHLTSTSASLTDNLMGTFHFLSPEVAAATEFPIGPKSDIWSLGCTVVEMLTTKPPRSNDTKIKLPRMIKLMTEEREPTYEFTQNVSELTRRSLKEYCFQYDPSDRKDAKYLLEHFGKG